MSKWPGKYVIGLTGNIGTGKSVVRRMLEHLGAYGIDADALSHRAIAKGAPGYLPVVETFGKWILTPEGEINRARLGKVVFSDPEALALLEKIVHPLVRQATDLLIRRSSQSVVVIEAIKLLESGMAQQYDSIWVVTAPADSQLARLMKNRGMTEADARRRMTAQPPQEQKTAAANMVIKNAGSFEHTWSQVQLAWQRAVPQTKTPPAVTARLTPEGELTVVRARPKHSADIARLINRLRPNDKPLRGDDVMAAFGEKAFLLLQSGPTLAGLIGWQVENLIARTTDILLDPALPAGRSLTALITEMERASRDLQCEASLVFVHEPLASAESTWRALGYERRPADTLDVQAWHEAALESMPPGATLLFKQLRQDRILRPI